MKILSNPWIQYEDYNCFGCSPRNPVGLKMIFAEEGNHIICEWEPEMQYQGYYNVLHGGIQAALMDEIASWTVFIKADKGAVTSRIDIRYRKPVYIKEGKIKLIATLLDINKRIASVKVKLFNSSDQLCSEALIDYFIITSDKSDKGLIFPGKEAFYQ